MATTHKRSLRPTEKAFLQQVREVAGLCGWLCYHTHDSRRSEPGFPDLVLVRSPSVVFAELKTDTGRLTPAQAAWLEALKQCSGIEAHVWRPGDWDAIVSRLKTGIS